MPREECREQYGVWTLGIDVLAYEASCARCGSEFSWVFGLIPAYRPAPEEFTTTDFPESVELARRILADPEGDTEDMARQLVDRPAWQKGRGFNPNRCSGCGEQADWHRLEGIITEAYHYGEIRAAQRAGAGVAVASHPRTRSRHPLARHRLIAPSPGAAAGETARGQDWGSVLDGAMKEGRPLNWLKHFRCCGVSFR